MSKYKALLGILIIFAVIVPGTRRTQARTGSELKPTRSEDHRVLAPMEPVAEFQNIDFSGGEVDVPTCTGEACDPPQVLSFSPTRDRVPIEVPRYWIAAEFDRAMSVDTLNKRTFTLEAPGGILVPGTVVYEGRVATFIPSQTLDYSTAYRVTLTGGQNGVLSSAGIPLQKDFSWTFTTESLDDMGPLVYHSFKIDDDSSGGSDGNGDQDIDPGETIELSVFLGNGGDATASEVSAIITSTDPYITFTSNTDSGYDNIIGWGTEPNSDSFEITVNQDAPCGHRVPFELAVSAAGGYSDIVPFSVPVKCNPPDAPGSPSPATGEFEVSLNPTLSVVASDPNGDELSVTFYGREIVSPSASEFEIITIPDTQYYTCDGNSLSCPWTPVSPYANDGRIETFYAQTQWIVDNKNLIAYVPHVGDLVQNADWYEEEWVRADAAMEILETGAPEIPFAIAFGNHDLRNLYGASASVSGDTFMNQYFGYDRFAGRGYYGGHFSFNNNNHYVLFERGNLEFIGIHLEYDREYESAVLDWADDLLKQYPERRAIVSRHAIIDESGSFVSDGDLVFETLSDNPNLFLLLCGHIDGEYIRADAVNGRTIHTILSDYQSEPNGGDGWLRRLQFSPANDQITVRSYSVLYDQWDWEDPKATGQRDLEYDMGYTTRQIATFSGVTSGSQVAATWADLLPDSRYEWYVTVSDGTSTTVSPLWHFTTGQEQAACYPLTLSYAGGGDVPLASPENSQGCSSGEYVAGETIYLTAFPAAGYRVGGWSGTVNDASTSVNNQVVMPGGAHSVSVHYVGDFNIYLPALFSGED